MQRVHMVLMYHDVYRESVLESGFQTGGANYYKLDACSFEKQVETLAGIPTTFTFDDGGESFYTVIAPILEKNGLKGHFFISTDFIGSNGFLNEDQIKDLLMRGHSIGSHSCSHPSDFRSLTDERRRKEWNDSIIRLNKLLGLNTTEISVPNGFLLEKDLPYLKSLGISTIYTSKIGEDCMTEGIHITGRLGVTREMSDTYLLNIISGGSAYRRLVIKQWLLSLAKKILGDKYVQIKKQIRK